MLDEVLTKTITEHGKHTEKDFVIKRLKWPEAVAGSRRTSKEALIVGLD